MADATLPGPDATVAAWTTRWWESVSVRPNTRRLYEKNLNGHVLPALGHLRLTDVTATHVEAMAAKLLKTLEPTTVVVVLATARVVFGAAARAGLIPGNPVSLARKPKQKRRKVETFSPADMLRLIGAADWYSGGGPVALMAGVGCRIGEAIALDVPDFDAAAGTVSITKTAHPDRSVGPPKSANGVRTIRVPAALLPVLTAAAAGRKTGPLFRTAAGRRYVHQMVSRGLEQILAALDLPRKNGHVLRHSVATQLIAAQVPIGDVAAYLGDSVATIVKTYIHATGADPADALDRLYSGRKVGDGGEQHE